jgi:hypothetical protein
VVLVADGVGVAVGVLVNVSLAVGVNVGNGVAVKGRWLPLQPAKIAQIMNRSKVGLHFTWGACFPQKNRQHLQYTYHLTLSVVYHTKGLKHKCTYWRGKVHLCIRRRKALRNDVDRSITQIAIMRKGLPK